MQSTIAERAKAFSGMSNFLFTFLKREEPGIAPSRAKAYVHLEAAVKAPIPAKNRIPKMRKRRPKPPAAEPVTVLNKRPMGCPFATESRVATSGRTKRIGIR